VLASLTSLAWKSYTAPVAWFEGDALLCHTLGAVRVFFTYSLSRTQIRFKLLIALHVWAAMESFEVLGVFGVSIISVFVYFIH
jgi:phosphatidylethanolamine N-methyltransferase